MSYIGKIEAQESVADCLPVPLAKPAAFSPLEWSVIGLAQLDRLWTVRQAGPLRRFWNRLSGRGNPSLANPKLEALRRMAVLTWHYGFTVPGTDVAAFLSAGFSPDQYELMVHRIRSALSAPQKAAA